MRHYIAANRFGLGISPRDETAPDPAAALIAQIGRFDPAPAALASLPGRRAQADALIELRDLAEGRAPMPADEPAMADMQDRAAARRQPPFSEDRAYARLAMRQIYFDAVKMRVDLSLASDAPFAERWVHFWANHFAVSVDKFACTPFVGDHEFRAIRPHVFGRFGALLRSAVLHPAMLLFLDQAQSIGPQSPAARFVARRRQSGRPLGLNENLAREILELHTLGVRTGYTQEDVTAFARALTGHTVAGLARGPARRLTEGAEPGAYLFVPAIHEPGNQRVLGTSHADSGAGQAFAILDMLAVHPATACHIATKLAVHFCADDPPATLVERLTADFLATGGDLSSLARTLVRSPEPWVAAPGKFKSPWDWGLSVMRGLGVRQLPDSRGATALFDQLGQTVWRPGSPAGWADSTEQWAGPAALVDRVDAAERFAAITGAGVDARALARTLLSDALSEATATAIARADSPSQGLAMLLVAPEFLRR